MVYQLTKLFLFTVAAASLSPLTYCLIPSPSFGMVGSISSTRISSNGGIWTRHTKVSPLAMVADEDIQQETYASVHYRIQELVEKHPVLLFMKGTKIFPQCGFSNTASQILHSFNIEFHAVDVLADEAIRQGVKEYSSWPTIPQLYVGGEFIGGSDIMIEMYQSGELGELIEKTLADKMVE
jgi:monothiol glutaredoxin